MDTTTTPRVVILTADDMARLSAMRYGDGIVALWNHILADAGELSLGHPDRTESVRPGAYALPKAQTMALLEAWTRNSGSAEAAPGIMMHWCNVGPSSTEG